MTLSDAAALLARLPEAEAQRLLAFERARLRRAALARRDAALAAVAREFFGGMDALSTAEEIALAWAGRRAPRDDSAEAEAAARMRVAARERLAELLGAEAEIPATRTIRRALRSVATETRIDGHDASVASGGER